MLVSSTPVKSPPLWWPVLTTSIMLMAGFMILTLLTQHPWPLTLSLSSTSDLMSAMLTLLTMWMTALMMMMSMMTPTKPNNPKTFALTLSLLAIALMAAFLSNNLLTFYIMFEASLIPTLFLILSWGYQPERLQAGKYLMLYTVTASLPFLLSINALFSTNTHLNMFNPFWSPPMTSTPLLTLWWLLTTLAFYIKTPLFFTHLWLPKAHVEAPISGSMILAGVLLKLGSYGLIRTMTLFPLLTSPLLTPLTLICLWGGVLTSLTCLRHSDLKALIAYSSVGHMALLTAALLTTNLWGWYGSLTMMLAHGLCSSALFSLASITYSQTNTRSLFLMKGLLTVAPQITLWWFLFSAMNMSAPPSLNLLAEISLLSSLLSKAMMLLLPLTLMTFLCAAYSLHMYSSPQHGHLPPLISPSLPPFTYYFLPLTLHLAPSTLLLLKLDAVTHWML